jgi:hypothetical protein
VRDFYVDALNTRFTQEPPEFRRDKSYLSRSKQAAPDSGMRHSDILPGANDIILASSRSTD